MYFKTTDELQENIFGLADADKFDCRLWTYDKSHSFLQIKAVYKAADIAYFLEFRMLEYFSGEIFWQGANVQLQPLNVCSKFIRTANLTGLIKIINVLEDIDSLNEFPRNLYTIPTTNGNIINIIAALPFLREAPKI